MTVWLVNAIKDDTTPALKWGAVRWISTHYIYGDELTDSGGIPESYQQNMISAVRHFNPDADFLLIAGDHLQLVTVAAMLGAKCGRFRVLRWDRHAQGYLPVWVNSHFEIVNGARDTLTQPHP